MSRRCDLTGKSVMVGHTVSHSNIKTKRRFLPNLLNVTMMSDALGRSVKLRVSANALKSVDHRGGLDAYLLRAKSDDARAARARTEEADREEAGEGGLVLASGRHAGARREARTRNPEQQEVAAGPWTGCFNLHERECGSGFRVRAFARRRRA